MTTDQYEEGDSRQQEQAHQEREEFDMLTSIGASYQPCRKHPEHSVYTDRSGRQNRSQCPECHADALARGGDYRPRDWAAGSDYHFDGRTLSVDSTGGRREVHTFGPGEKLK